MEDRMTYIEDEKECQKHSRTPQGGPIKGGKPTERPDKMPEEKEPPTTKK